MELPCFLLQVCKLRDAIIEKGDKYSFVIIDYCCPHSYKKFLEGWMGNNWGEAELSQFFGL